MFITLASSPSNPGKTSPFWDRYFKQNAERWKELIKILESEELALNPEFIESIQAFQLGEQSEGRCLLQLAQQYAATHDDPEYFAAIQLFIKEEQRHARCLKLALQANDSPAMDKNWTDSLFRKIRKLCGLEMMVSVLFTAEIIAVAYYGCLAKASKHLLARSLFERILKDEAMHLRFHGEHLRKLRGQGQGSRFCSGLHRLFVWSVACVVWHEHNVVLRHDFGTFGKFLERCNTQLSQALMG